MEIPRVTDAHKKLLRLAGTWTGDEKILPSPFDPKGGAAKGRVDNRVALAGFVLIQDYTQERTGKPDFEGHAVISWDPSRDSYVMTWWDSMGMPCNVFVGPWTGDTLTLTHESHMGRSRAIWTLGKGDRTYTFRMETSQTGQPWAPFMEGTYTKE